MEKSIGIIIGNGPSQKYYRNQDGFKVVCNLNWHIPHDVVSIIDPQPIEYIYKNQLLTDKLVWTSPKANRLIQQYQLQLEVEQCHNTAIPYNNAQFACLKLLSLAHTTIHIYGCDTLWSDDMTSNQDTMIPRPHRDLTLYVQWRQLWQKIFTDNRQIDFYIHSPVNIDCVEYGVNVKYHQHLTFNQQLASQSNK